MEENQKWKIKKGWKKMTRRQYSMEFKVRVCEDYLNNDMTYKEISRFDDIIKEWGYVPKYMD
jgi:transposase-like protein